MPLSKAVEFGSRAPVLVLGAGPAGLAAALEIVRSGQPVLVLERVARVGGLSATLSAGGYLFDYGGHRVMTTDPGLVALMTGLLGDDLLRQPRRTQILFQGRLFEHPLRLPQAVRALPLSSALQCGLSFAACRALDLLGLRPEESFADWVANRFGRRLYEIFFGPYTAKVWGRDPKYLHASWAAQRIMVPSLTAVLRETLSPARRRSRMFAETYLYPRLGIGQLFEAMAAEVRRLGGLISLESKCVSLRRAARPSTGGLFTASWREPGDKGRAFRTLDVAGVVSTIPLENLVGLLDPGPPSSVAAAAAGLSYRALIVAGLVFAWPQLMEVDALYVPDPDYIFFRVEQPRLWSPALVPDPAMGSLLLEISCEPGDDTWRAPWKTLRPRVLGDLVRLGLITRHDEPRQATLFRARRAYPVNEIGSEARRETILGWLGGVPGLEVCGRQGLFRYVDLDVAMLMGQAAARRIVAGPEAAPPPDSFGRGGRHLWLDQSGQDGSP